MRRYPMLAGERTSMLKCVLAVGVVLAVALGLPTAALAGDTVVGKCNGTGNSASDVCVFVVAGGGGGEGQGLVLVTNYSDSPALVGVTHESLGSSERGGSATNCLTNLAGDRYQCTGGSS